MQNKLSQFIAEKTPFYFYDLDGLRNRAEFFKSKMPKNSLAFYAMKANNNIGVMRALKSAGFGVDAVSKGEIHHALSLGFDPQSIVFSGVGKTKGEIEFALSKNIFQINVESFPELERIANTARALGCVAHVALRMNPDVDAKTHPYITTGFRENKFGLDFSELPAIIKFLKSNKSALSLKGLTLHIGSQIRDIKPFQAAIKKTLSLYGELRSEGFSLETFDVGGGLGIRYESDDLSEDQRTIEEYMNGVAESVSGFDGKVLFEPGRILVARFGSLVCEVQYVKRTPHKNFIIVDAGMHLIMRPALYEAYHRILPLTIAGKAVHNSQDLKSTKQEAADVFDVVGPICESTDVLGKDRYLPKNIREGDRLVICDAGAYGAVMSSRYNLHEPLKEICSTNKDC